jgi:hypothetical protein
MRHCTPRNPHRKFAPAPDNTPTLYCGDAMKHLRTIRELGVFPERHIFVCPSCKRGDTKDVKRVG